MLRLARTSTQPKLRADPVGKATDGGIGFGSGAGESLEHVLHLRHDLKRDIDAGLSRESASLRLSSSSRSFAALVSNVSPVASMSSQGESGTVAAGSGRPRS